MGGFFCYSYVCENDLVLIQILGDMRKGQTDEYRRVLSEM